MKNIASFNSRERRISGSQLVTGSEVGPHAGASCVITTDSEKSLVSRQASHVQ